jgi:hypothetical protein
MGQGRVRSAIDGVIVVRDRLRRVKGPRVAVVADALERVKSVGVCVHDALAVQIGDQAGNYFSACSLALAGVRERVVDVRNSVHNLNRVGVGGNVVADADVHLRAEVPVAGASQHVRATCETWPLSPHLVCKDFIRGPSL